MDLLRRGSGWKPLAALFGSFAILLPLSPALSANFIPPIAEYDHTGGRCSVIGGYVYRGTKSTFPIGAYIYADFCTGEIFQHFPASSGGTQTLLLDTTLSISSFGEDEAGEIYVVGLGGTVHRLTDGSGALKLELVLASLSSPLFVTSGRDGSNRLFFVEQTGRILVLQSGMEAVFLDIRSKVLSGGEQGLLGLAFHPQYAANRRFFVNYTRQPDGATVIAEYRASASDPNIADPGETQILTIAQPFANHNGGMLEFGPDDFLYIGMGDGGSGNDPGNRAQDIEDLLGKMLRINVDMPSGGLPYSSPADNPFFGAIPGRDEIYAVGLRNPFRFSFDRGTGQLYAGDVGQSQREEIDIITLGGNYGWRVFEGTLCTNLDPQLCSGDSSTVIVASDGGTCIIATSVYGSPLAEDVRLFRQFRDRYLVTHMPGRLLVSAYYRLSPPLARAIAASETLRSVSRSLLLPVVWWARLSLVSPVLAILSCGGIVLGSLALGVALTRVPRRGKGRGFQGATELSGLDAAARTAPRPG
jgi:hypothetical protein